jgi:hypothetical protein
MPREWHPLRLFVRDDGHRHPTILFWLFFVPLMAIVVAGCYAVLNRRAEQTRVAAALTGTPMLATADASTPTATSTLTPPAVEPTPTEYVYDDPSGWEFVERTDPTGKKYLDLQDWQREQVWHAFQQYWDLWYRAEDGLTPYEEVEPLIAGSFAEGVRSGYETSLQLGQYVYVVLPLNEISRAMVLESAEQGNVKVKVVLASDVGFEVQRRDIHTGEVVETNRRFPYRTWSFVLTYVAGRWVIENTAITELE